MQYQQAQEQLQKEREQRRRHLKGKKSVRYQEEEDEKSKKDIETFQGDKKYKFLKDQVTSLKQQERKSRTIYEWFQ